MRTQVYVIAAEECGPVKIGVSTNPTARLSQLQTAYHSRLNLICAFPVPSRRAALEIERDVHEAFAEYKMLGEWFSISAEIAAYIVGENVEAREVLSNVSH